MVYPPYDEGSIFYGLQVAPKINRVRSPYEGWRKIHALGGSIDSDSYDEWAGWFQSQGETSTIGEPILEPTGVQSKNIGTFSGKLKDRWGTNR